MKTNKIIKVLSIGLSLPFLMSTLVGCTTTAEISGPLQVETAEVTQGNLDTNLQLTGVLLPNQTINITSKLSGEVVTANYNVGDNVEAGALLFKLDTHTLDAQIQQAQAASVSAESAYQASKSQTELLQINLNVAQKAYDDKKVLYDSQIISKSELDDAKNKLDLAKKQVENAQGPQQNQAKAAVGSANANINILQVQKDNATITNPINGVVLSRNVQLGEIATQGATLMTIADLSVLKMKGTVSQEYLPYLKVGQTIEIEVDIYPGKKFTASISTIGPMAVSTGKLFPIELTIDNKDNLMAGLTATASVAMKGEQHLLIPNSAVVNDQGESHVFVIEDQKAIRKNVVLGLSNDESVEILSGLSQGEIVAINNTQILQDQMPVSTAK